MADILIRKGMPGDLEALVEFNYMMALETEHKELDRSKLIPGVENALKGLGECFYIVAEHDSDVVGSLMVTKEWSDWRNGFFLWIQSVYIRPQFRRKGIYRKLYDKVKEIASCEVKCCGYRLYVEKNNFNARKTYESLGMKETCYLIYEEETHGT